MRNQPSVKERKKEGKEGGDFLLWLRTSCLQLAARIDQSQTEKESYVSVGRMKRGTVFEGKAEHGVPQDEEYLKGRTESNARSVLFCQIAIKADFPFMKVHSHLHILRSLKFICI